MVAKKRIRQSFGSRLFDTANVCFLVLLAVATLYPFYYVAIVSISDGRQVVIGAVRHLPISPNLESYRVVLNKPIVPISYRNTLIYTVVGTFINLSFSSFCAYPLARRTFYGRKLFTAMIVFTMFFQGGLIPLYLTVRALGLLNTIWAIVLPGAIGTYYMIIMRTFFQGIPEEIQDSAHIDGANDIHVFFRIILPMSTPLMATMTLFYAVEHWNSFFPALIYLRERTRYPIQLILRSIVIEGDVSAHQVDFQEDERIISTTVKYAIIMVSTLPILLLYPFLQKYFVKGIMVGSLKG